MADTLSTIRIDQLDEINSVTGTEVIPIVKEGLTRKITLNSLAAMFATQDDLSEKANLTHNHSTNSLGGQLNNASIATGANITWNKLAAKNIGFIGDVMTYSNTTLNDEGNETITLTLTEAANTKINALITTALANYYTKTEVDALLQ